MQKMSNIFDLKRQPIWLRRTVTYLFLLLILTSLVMVGLGLWNMLLIPLIIFIIIITLSYASHYLTKIFWYG